MRATELHMLLLTLPVETRALTRRETGTAATATNSSVICHTKEPHRESYPFARASISCPITSEYVRTEKEVQQLLDDIDEQIDGSAQPSGEDPVKVDSKHYKARSGSSSPFETRSAKWSIPHFFGSFLII